MTKELHARETSIPNPMSDDTRFIQNGKTTDFESRSLDGRVRDQRIGGSRFTSNGSVGGIGNASHFFQKDTLDLLAHDSPFGTPSENIQNAKNNSLADNHGGSELDLVGALGSLDLDDDFEISRDSKESFGSSDEHETSDFNNQNFNNQSFSKETYGDPNSHFEYASRAQGGSLTPNPSMGSFNHSALGQVSTPTSTWGNFVPSSAPPLSYQRKVDGNSLKNTDRDFSFSSKPFELPEHEKDFIVPHAYDVNVGHGSMMQSFNLSSTTSPRNYGNFEQPFAPLSGFFGTPTTDLSRKLDGSSSESDLDTTQTDFNASGAIPNLSTKNVSVNNTPTSNFDFPMFSRVGTIPGPGSVPMPITGPLPAQVSDIPTMTDAKQINNVFPTADSNKHILHDNYGVQYQPVSSPPIMPMGAWSQQFPKPRQGSSATRGLRPQQVVSRSSPMNSNVNSYYSDVARVNNVGNNGSGGQNRFGVNRRNANISTTVHSKGHNHNRRKGDDSKYVNASLDEFTGNIFNLCKDQHGCRFLQRQLDLAKTTSNESKNKSEIASTLIFNEVYLKIVELMSDPFGNYLVQKLFESVTTDQRIILVRNAAPSFIKVAMNPHGTRALQKLVECVSTPEESKIIIDTFAPHIVALSTDLNGNHVIQKCLSKFSKANNQFIFDAASKYCDQIATHRHGCCVLQRCIDYGSPNQRKQLAQRVSVNTTGLSLDPFGNYVVQYVLSKGDPESVSSILQNIRSNIYSLSLHKFGSNVIEKSLHRDSLSEPLIDELLQHKEKLSTLLNDPFGNYVLQTSLDVANQEQSLKLSEALQPLLVNIKNTPHGRRISAKIQNLL